MKGNNAIVWLQLNEKVRPRGNSDIFWRPDGEKEVIQLSHDYGAHQKVGDALGNFRCSKIETDLNQSILAGRSISMGRPKFQWISAAQRPNWDVRLPTKETSQHHEPPLVSVKPGGAKELWMVYFRNQRVPEMSQITFQFMEFDVKASVSWLLSPATWIHSICHILHNRNDMTSDSTALNKRQCSCCDHWAPSIYR